MNITVKHFYSV